MALKSKTDTEKIKSLADFTSKNPEPSLRIARDGKLIYANAASLPLTADWGARIGEAVPDEWQSLAKEVLTSGLRENIEVECKGRIYSFIMVPVREASYVNLYGRDITERKRAMERLERAYEELKRTQSQLVQAEKMRVVGTLASSIAHELKNPLATILQGLDYLSKNIKSADKEVSSVLDFMKDAVKRADSTVKNLLDFSGLSLSDMKKENLNSVVERSILLVKSRSEKTRVNIVRDFDKSIPPVIIDRNRIEQVFVNLFLNSIEAMAGGGELKIKTYAKKKEKTVIAEVEDTGRGVPEDMLGKIFEPFFTTKRHNGGTGLGLSIVKNIMDMHHGTVEIKNGENGGARTTVTFRA